MSAGGPRERILERVRSAVAGRTRHDRPAAFGSWRPTDPASGGDPDPALEFIHMFERAGGEVVQVQTLDDAVAWLREGTAGATGVAVGATLPAQVAAGLSAAAAESAEVGVSMARGAVAETGSLMLDARDGRRGQLLPPTHFVLVRRSEVHVTLAEALASISGDLPSALGLHSGPSKSADIGQVLVKGVHGPGRVIALLIEENG